MVIREIVFDTETTGLDPITGDRLVEIGCVELLNSIPTGDVFHRYINPERDVSAEAFRVHGLSREFLSDKPKFAEIAAEFVAFIGDAKLVAHNADFDFKFVNAELRRANRELLLQERIVDTLALARRKHPGSPNSLDALCSRYGIDNSRRTKHGALLDAEILAEVYLELCGGRQTALMLAASGPRKIELQPVDLISLRPEPLASLLNALEAEKHSGLIEAMGEKGLWQKYQ